MNKTLEYYLELPYTIELSLSPDEGWFVRVKELPGCMSQGDTAEEALAMIQEAMSLWLEVALEDGLAIPEPRPAEDYSGKFVVRMPRSLHRDLSEKAADEGVSLNQLVVTLLAQATSQAQPQASPPSESQAEPYWPGLKAGVRRALLAAGLEDDAGELDEQLFARWIDQLLSQIESTFQDSYAQESALPYLDSLEANLYTAATKSPVLAALRRTTRLLHQQIQGQVQLQKKIVTSMTWQRKLEQVREAEGREPFWESSWKLAGESAPMHRHSFRETRTFYWVRPKKTDR